MTEPAPEAKPPDRPRVLVLARRLWIASALVTFLRTMVQYADRKSLLEDLARMRPELDQAEIDDAATSTIGFGLLLSALSVLVYMLLATRVLEGQNWARVLLTVFGGFSVLSTVVLVLAVPTFPPETMRELVGRSVSGWELLVTVVATGLSVAAIVCMYQGAASRFFREMRAHRPAVGAARTGSRG